MELGEGDVYRWSYKPGKGGDFDPYWCKSRIAIVSNGRLEDTYWISDRYVVPLDSVTLEFVCNLADLEPTTPDAYDRYEPEHVVDLRHPNGGAIYIRKGAKPSKRVQIESWTWKRDRAQATVEFCQARIDELSK